MRDGDLGRGGRLPQQGQGGARLYIGNPEGGWPLPKSKLNLEAEMRSYADADFAALKDDLAGVDFFVDRLVTSASQLAAIRDQLKQADGILLIQLSIGIDGVLHEFLALGGRRCCLPCRTRPRMDLLRRPGRRGQEAPFDCLLTADRRQLAAAVRPLCTMHVSGAQPRFSTCGPARGQVCRRGPRPLRHRNQAAEPRNCAYTT